MDQPTTSVGVANVGWNHRWPGEGGDWFRGGTWAGKGKKRVPCLPSCPISQARAPTRVRRLADAVSPSRPAVKGKGRGLGRG